MINKIRKRFFFQNLLWNLFLLDVSIRVQVIYRCNHVDNGSLWFFHTLSKMRRWLTSWLYLPDANTDPTLRTVALSRTIRNDELHSLQMKAVSCDRIPICVFLHVSGFSHLVSCSCTFTRIFFWLDLEIYPSEQWMNQRLFQVQTWQWGLCQEEMMQMVRTVAHFPSFFSSFSRVPELSHVRSPEILHVSGLPTFHVCSDSRHLTCLVSRCLTCVQSSDVSRVFRLQTSHVSGL